MNKNVKKIFSFLLCTLMIFSFFTVTTFAEDTQKTTIEVENHYDMIPEYSVFTLVISVKNATALSEMDIDIKFDNEYLEYVNMEGNINIPDMSSNCNYWGNGHAQFECTFGNGGFSGSDEVILLTLESKTECEFEININVNSWQGENQPENATFSFYIGEADNKTSYKGLVYKASDNGIIITSNDEKTTGDIVIPSEIDGLPVIAIGREEFYGFRDITSITIPATVTDIDISTFSTCSELEKFIVDENNQYYSSDEHGVLFDKSKSKLLRYPLGNASEEYIIPTGVTVISEEAFAHAKKLKEVKIPDTVKTIEAAAFLATWKLERIVIPDSVTKLTGNTFSNSGIKSAVLPAGINVIETRLFDCCVSLESVVIPASITHIDDFAFSMCDKLKNIYYTGSQYDWNIITVSDIQNAALTEADFHYNYIGFILSDVNGDFTVTAADARLVLRASAELETLEGNRFSAADVDENGEITASDARKILRISAGLD